jgi:hypothetical protein
MPRAAAAAHAEARVGHKLEDRALKFDDVLSRRVPLRTKRGGRSRPYCDQVAWRLQAAVFPVRLSCSTSKLTFWPS